MWDVPRPTITRWLAASAKGTIVKSPLRDGSYRKTFDGTWLVEYEAIKEKTRREPVKSLQELYKGGGEDGTASGND